MRKETSNTDMDYISPYYMYVCLQEIIKTLYLFFLLNCLFSAPHHDKVKFSKQLTVLLRISYS